MENGSQQQQKMSRRTRKIAFAGMFAAIAAVLMFLEFPLPFTPPFYKLDFSEIPVLLETFSLGPVAGVVIEFLKILVKTLIKGTSTAFVGELANFIIGCAFVLPAGLIYKARKTRNGAILGLTVGVLVMTIMGCFINAFVLLPVYAAAFHMPIEELVKMGTAVNGNVNNLFTFVMLCVAPFNLIKGVVVSVLTFLIYKRVSRLVKGLGS